MKYSRETLNILKELKWKLSIKRRLHSYLSNNNRTEKGTFIIVDVDYYILLRKCRSYDFCNIDERQIISITPTNKSHRKIFRLICGY